MGAGITRDVDRNFSMDTELPARGMMPSQNILEIVILKLSTSSFQSARGV